MDTKKNAVIFLTLIYILWSPQTGADTVPSPSTTSSPQDQDRLAYAVNDFGYKLMTQIMKQNLNKNIVISPTGISGLLAMTLLGSVGSTYDELANSLGFSQDILTNRQNHEQFGELLEALNADNTTSRTLYADAIFVNAHTQIRASYRDYLDRVYQGDSVAADFENKEKAKELINDWVKNHTNGKIEDFLKEPLPVSTKVVLLSALYFSGQWERPFVPEFTRGTLFQTPSGEVIADLMLNYGTFNYTASVNDGLHMIAFPYNDSDTVMYALKPRFPKKMNLTDLIDSLDYTKIENLINKMSEEECVVRFPKMELKSSSNLEKSLKALGVKSMFNPSEANFALMVDGGSAVSRGEQEDELILRINRGDVESQGLRDMVNSLPNPGVFVDSVLHDVKMTINEYGTEAVAATSGILARSAVLFYVDSPFYIFIRNERTKLITFSAAIFDPTL